MKIINATKARQNFSSSIETVKKEPIIISKKNKNIAVIVSYERYKELEKIEDILYAKAAQLALKEGFATKQETDDLFNKIG